MRACGSQPWSFYIFRWMFCSHQGKKRAALRAVFLFCCHPDRSGGIPRRQARFFCLLPAGVLPFRVDALDQGDLFLPRPALALLVRSNRGCDVAGVLARDQPRDTIPPWQTGGPGRTCAGTHAARGRWLRRSRVPERFGIMYPLKVYSGSKVAGRRSRLAARDLSAAVEMTQRRDDLTQEAADIAQSWLRAVGSQLSS